MTFTWIPFFTEGHMQLAAPMLDLLSSSRFRIFTDSPHPHAVESDSWNIFAFWGISEALRSEKGRSWDQVSILICSWDYRDVDLAVPHSAIDYWSHSLRIRLDSLSDFSATASAGDLNVLKAFDDEVVYLRTAIRAIHARRNHTIPTSLTTRDPG